MTRASNNINQNELGDGEKLFSGVSSQYVRCRCKIELKCIEKQFFGGKLS